MMHLEEELKRALRREPPAPGFADRVLRRIAEAEAPRRRPVWWRAVAASAALTALVSGYVVHEQAERRREGEHAREQVLLALRIAGEKVRYAQQEVHDIGK